jgi:DNA repair protein RadC
MHNHSPGDPTPSRVDIQITQQIVDIEKSLGISVHDRIMHGRGTPASRG